MREMRYILVLFISLFFIKITSAQRTPGYMGKRLIVEYSGSTAPAIFRPNKNGNNGFDPIPPEFNLPFNYGHKLTVNYSLNRKIGVGASFELYSTGTDLSNVFFLSTSIDQFGNNNRTNYSAQGTEENPETFTGIVNIKGISLFRTSYRNGIAPLGKHSIIGFKLLFVSTDLSQVDFIGTERINNQQVVDVHYNLPSGGLTTTEWGIFYGVGVNRIIHDKIVLSLGFELAFIYSALGEFAGNYERSYDFSDGGRINASQFGNTNVNNGIDSAEELFKKMGAERAFSSQFFNLKIGIGFLAY